MKNKYVMIGGFAFSEESDMEKLKNYAKKGWILEDIVAGFFYKLKKDKPQDIEYSLDYQSEASDEYFNIFSEAGWEHVLSFGNETHIFSAKEGTKPIYSDTESEIDKYMRVKKQMGKGTIYSLISAIVFGGLSVVSVNFIKPIFLIVLGLFFLSFIAFIFSFMPFCAYSFRLNQLYKNGNNNSKVTPDKPLSKIYIVTGCIFIFLGIIDLIEKKHFGVVWIVIGICNIFISLSSGKK